MGPYMNVHVCIWTLSCALTSARSHIHVSSQVEDMKRRFEEFRRDYEKRKEHLKEEAGRKAKQVAEDNKHLQK